MCGQFILHPEEKSFTEHLEQAELPIETRPKMMIAGPLTEEQLAKQRVEVFLAQQKAKAAIIPGS